MLPYCILTLRSSVNRQEHITHEFNRYGLDPIFFYGVDAREMSTEELHSKTIEPNILKAGEIGCALSHLAIYQKMINENIPAMLIFEDDIRLTDELIKDLPAIESFVNKNLLKTSAVLLLREAKEYLKKSIDLSSTHSIHQVQKGVGAYAYVITLDAARNILQIQNPIKWEIDSWKFYYYLKALDLYAINRPIIKLTGLPSIIAKIDTRFRNKPNIIKRKIRFLTCLWQQKNAISLFLFYYYCKFRKIKLLFANSNQ